MICIENANIVLERSILGDGVLLIENDRIIAVGTKENIQIPHNAKRIDVGGGYVGPGFVDIHNHGGNGCSFDKDPAGAAKFFLRHGETTVLGAFYHDLTKDEFLAATRRVISVMETSEAANLAGCYMEGPYLNPEYGAGPEENKWRGPIVPEDYEELVNCAGSVAKIWSISPEREGIESFVAYAKKVIPSLVFTVAHSEATKEQIEKMKPYGLRILTHALNATGTVPQLRGVRGCGPDETCMLDDDMYAEMICDSLAIHVNPHMQKLLLKVKGVDKMILITDSVVCDAPSPENMQHIKDLCFDANGYLSGSMLTMDLVLQNVMKHTGCSLTDAFLMTSRNPARVLGMEQEIGSVEAGKKANLVFLNGEYELEKVMLNGEFYE